jgi:hypothetical protein
LNLGWLYPHIATSSGGWTYAEIDQLTLWDVNELMEYWADHPPAHIILAAVHMKPRSSGRAKAQPGNMREELASEASKFGLGGSAGPLPAIYRNKKAVPVEERPFRAVKESS